MESKSLLRLCIDLIKVYLREKSYRKFKTPQPCSTWSDMADRRMPKFAMAGKLAAAVLWVGPTPRGGYASITPHFY